MEVPMSQQGGEMAIPLNTAYGYDQPHPHPHNNSSSSSSIIVIPNSTNGPRPPTPIPTNLDHRSSVPYNGKKTTPSPTTTVVKYKECLKNHAAAMGGNATDGCGEFMPSGEEGTLEALTCSACACHRNFHRKQTSPDDPGRPPALFHYPHHHPKGGAYFPPPLSRTMTSHHHHQMIVPYTIVAGGGGDDDSDHEMGEDPITMRSHSQSQQQQQQRKRFRTKFTQEQKEKMLGFAERVGWKIQKQEEAMVHQFCQEVGIKRRVLKVWMHNNKHNLARRNTTTTATNNNNDDHNPINTATTSCSSLQHQPTTSIIHTHHLQGTG